MSYKKMEFKCLLGKTLTNIQGSKGSDEIIFTTSDREIYKLFHEQDWCEHVSVEDICGNLEDLVDSPILLAEEVSNCETPIDTEINTEHYESYTWTFYKLATIKGYVTIRWYGESNGYYCESVEFCKVEL